MKEQELAAINSEEFILMEKKRKRISILLTCIILFLYFGFVLVIAYKKDLLKPPVGILTGLGIIISAWLLTGIYVFWANRVYDKEKKSILNKYFTK